MRYLYFISFVTVKNGGYEFGNIDIAFPCNIENITELRWAEFRIKEKIHTKKVIILNYQLLRRLEVPDNVVT